MHFLKTRRDPTKNFGWDYVFVDNDVKMLGVCQEVKLQFIQDY